LIKEVAESFCIDLSDFGFWELMVGVGGYLCRGIDGCFYEISRDYDFIRYLSRDPHSAVNAILGNSVAGVGPWRPMDEPYDLLAPNQDPTEYDDSAVSVCSADSDASSYLA
jgi:hypothetical protein